MAMGPVMEASGLGGLLVVGHGAQLENRFGLQLSDALTDTLI